jgi:Zn-finger nucleic acid-binding protein
LSGPYRESVAPGRPCPRCRLALDRRELGDAVVDECAACAGVFVGREVMPRIVDPLDLGGEVARAYPRGHPVAVAPGPLYVPCPCCGTVMNRRQFAAGAKVVVDVCRDHGVWFDTAELRAVADFAAGGGMERAAREEEQRLAAEARRHRTDDRLELPRAWHGSESNDGIARLLDLLAALFH